MIKLLIGGSPCTHWSIAQTKNRETTAEGVGWELFKNYLIALEKYKPDYFLYENNKSMSSAIREQITKELGVEPIMINSALVSAQSRQRLYWTNIPGVEQPEDRGILLRDILESGVHWREKAYTLRASAGTKQGICNVIKHTQTGGKFGYQGVYEPIYSPSGKMLTEAEMEYMVRETRDGRNHFAFEYFSDAGQDKSACITANIHKGVPYNVCAEPIRIGTIESDAKNADFDSQQYRVYSPDGKAVTLCGQGGGVGAKTGLYATPIRVGDMPNAAGEISGSQSGRIHSIDGKSVPLQARPNGGGADGAATGLYAIPAGIAWRGREDGSSYEVRDDQKANTVTADGHQSRLVIEDVAIFNNPHGFNNGGIKYDKAPTLTANGDWQHNNFVIESADGKTWPVYAVKDGQITIKGKQYPIKLADGFYIIRKLTVTECKRLQTVPEEYTFPVSDTQAYKMLGNGWTVDVIAHILGYAPGIQTEPLEVFSMYDGMACGHIALDKLGGHITRYFATEIDKYAIKTTMHNFPDVIQLGDAFQVRGDDWRIPEAEPETEPEETEMEIDAPTVICGADKRIGAVIKYPGAKWRLADWIIGHFPKHRSYLEPFFGSGAVLFRKSRSPIETVNDLDGDVVNLFDWIRKDPERLAREIALTPYARDEYERAYAAKDTETDSFQRAVDFYIRMMMGHGFRMTGEKVGWKNDVQGREAAYAVRQWGGLPETIIKAAERLLGVQIENKPAIELIRRFNYPNVLIYADPPYVLSTRYGNRKQYRHEMTDADHADLLEALKVHTGPVIISGYETELYNDILRGWHKASKAARTQTTAERTETIWMNFEPEAQISITEEGKE